MKINILLPYKEKFDRNKASSVSITVKNNLHYSKYFKDIKIYGQHVDNPIFENNFIGLKYHFFSFKSKNKFLAHQMLRMISKDNDKKHLIEIHNRPYLVDLIAKANEFPISLFLHNDPLTMKGSKTISDRRKILEKCDAVFCVSLYIKEKFLLGINSNLKKIHVLHNGVDRATNKFPKKKKEVLFVGRLVPEKGVDLYVDVIEAIANKFPDWKFSLIGSHTLGYDGKTSLFANQIIKKFENVSYQTKYYGFKNHDFVQKKMESCSIIVIPSIWEEPFGLVAAEAMSNGVAIIASSTGGIPEIVKKNGILIKNITKQKIKDELVRLIINSKLRKKIQKASWDNFKVSAKSSSNKLDYHRKLILTKNFVYN